MIKKHIAKMREKNAQRMKLPKWRGASRELRAITATSCELHFTFSWQTAFQPCAARVFIEGDKPVINECDVGKFLRPWCEFVFLNNREDPPVFTCTFYYVNDARGDLFQKMVHTTDGLVDEVSYLRLNRLFPIHVACSDLLDGQHVDFNGTPAIMQYNGGVSTRLICHCDNDGQIHRDDEPQSGQPGKARPALVRFDGNGLLCQERYLRHGFFYRANGPSVVKYENGTIVSTRDYTHFWYTFWPFTTRRNIPLESATIAEKLSNLLRSAQVGRASPVQTRRLSALFCAMAGNNTVVSGLQAMTHKTGIALFPKKSKNKKQISDTTARATNEQ